MLKKILISLLKTSPWVLRVTALLYSLPSLARAAVVSRRCLVIAHGAFLSGVRFDVHGNDHVVTIHPENRLKNCVITLIGSGCRVHIGRHCILNNLELWIQDDGGEIVIGRRTTVEGGHIAATEGKRIVIGEDCMFSHRIEIRNGDSHAIFDMDSCRRINPAESVVIGNHVWLGADVKVMKGSVVGDGAIVAAGAILTGMVKPASVVAGVPARKVKENIRWERER